ncbi:MAG: TolC family protein [Gemmatimonadota bacterium]|jgi:outer membrane protein TolC
MIFALTLTLGLAALPQQDTMSLSLAEAVERAHQDNPALVAQRAAARAQAQAPLEASRAFLPDISFGVTGMRTTDPVAVFGLKLRQAEFAQQDLALDALNSPSAYDGFSSTGTVQLPILAPEGIFGYQAAKRGAEASTAGAQRAAGATEYFVTQAYWDAQLAAASLGALDEALASANAHADQAEAMREQGLVTGLDARLARIGAAEVETRRLAAAAQAENARSALRAMLALPEDTRLILVDSLLDAPGSTCAADAEACDLSRRADLRARRLGVEASSLGVRSAWASHFPTLAAFGSMARHSQSTPWGSGSGDWTIGIGLSWNPFPALSGVGSVRKAEAERDEAAARLDDAERTASLEVLQAQRMLRAATERVSVATSAWQEAQEALDQAQLRYRTGTAPITELLDVQAATTATRLSLLSAQRDEAVAAAALDFAFGAFDR